MEHAAIRLQIVDLRRRKGAGQQEVADAVGVSRQTVSKWETGAGMPDISLLPPLAAFFGVTVDTLLGLSPLDAPYRPTESGTAGYWAERREYLDRTRNAMWNTDYMRFLIQTVWKVDKPVRVADFGCGSGFLGRLMMPLLPAGSTYTGIDHDAALLAEAEQRMAGASWPTRLVEASVYDFDEPGRYDLAVCQALLRHLDRPGEALDRMVCTVGPGGRVVGIEVNREFECDGLYLDGMAYETLCERGGWRRLWRREREVQGRDHAIGMRLPFLMRACGLVDIDVRFNDKVQFSAPGMEGHEQARADLLASRGWDGMPDGGCEEALVAHLVNHGMLREEAEAHARRMRKIAAHARAQGDDLAWLHVLGLLVTSGRRPDRVKEGR